MNTEPMIPFQNPGRYEKTFEVIQGKDEDLIALFHIAQHEAERIFSSKGSVPEGTAVKIALVGTDPYGDGEDYAEGELRICDADDANVYGFTYQKVIYEGDEFKYRKKEFQSTVFYSQQITVAVGRYVAVTKNYSVGATNAVVEGNVGKYLYVGTNGVMAAPGFAGVGASPAGKAVAIFVGNDDLPKQHSDGLTKTGSLHKEIYVHVNV